LAWRLVLGNVNNHSYTFDLLDVMEFAVMFGLHRGCPGMMLRYKNSLFFHQPQYPAFRLMVYELRKVSSKVNQFGWYLIWDSFPTPHNCI